MDLSTDFKEYHEKITSSLVSATRTANQLASQDLGFHRSSSDKVARALDTQTTHLLRLTSKLLKAATQDSSVKAPRLKDQEDVEDNWRGVVDVVDDLLEKADASLDEFTGAIKRMSPSVPSSPQPYPSPAPAQSQNYKGRPQGLPKVTGKPQEYFHRKVDNANDGSIFKPILLTKPNAVQSLAESIGDGSTGYLHPYAHEIDIYHYPPTLHTIADPIPSQPANSSSPILVDTEPALLTMLSELKQAKEIAVDLEHHDYRTYRGLVCLMQISTREKDWIVDTLKPWREKLQILNEVFTDPTILKVFHGSSSDMIWLQRDLGLYVVGLFDTYYASEALNFPHKGLRYLLERFVNFQAQKQYQLADWRIRPLPPNLIEYARSDTHYLLYIYDCLRNLLIENSVGTSHDLMQSVLEGSKKESLQVYEHFVYNPESGRGTFGWFNLWTQRSGPYSTAQFAAFRALHEWRDQKAREMDESPVWVFNNVSLWKMAENMPTNQTDLHRAVRPVTENLGLYAKQLFGVIAEAKKRSLVEPSVAEAIQENFEKYGVTRNRWAKKMKPQENNDSGVGATLQHLKLNGDIANNLKASADSASVGPDIPIALRADKSVFWGGISLPMPKVFGGPDMVRKALQNVFPLSAISNQLFSGPVEALPASTKNSMAVENVSSPVVPVSTSSPTANDIFTLRQQGHNSLKRKAQDSVDVDDEPVSAMDVDVPVNSTNGNSTKPPPSEVDLAKIASKAAIKASKKAVKEAKKAADEQKAYNMVPFDYANAESMLHPEAQPQTGEKVKKASSNANAPMNPFAKALDTSTGARRNRLGKEQGGKSMTFQS